MTTNRDLNDLIKKAKADGWCVEYTRKNHVRFTPPGGSISFVCSGTPSSPRICEHVKLQMRRVLAGHSNRLPPEQQRAALAKLATMV